MILFFRVGDFYETFYEDAKIAASELNIVLTARGREGDEEIPLAGVPYHSIDNYISRLIKRNYKVAICDQLEDAKDAKGTVVERDVTRIITPGTITESNFLDETSNNYLASIHYENNIFGFSYIDVSTTDFFVSQYSGEDAATELFNEIFRVSPVEILLCEELYLNADFTSRLQKLFDNKITINQFENEYPQKTDDAIPLLTSQFQVATLEGFGINRESFSQSVVAAAAIILYLKQTQKNSISHIKKITPLKQKSYMHLDSQSRLSLDIVPSLFNVLNFTKTAMGARLLRNFIETPLCDVQQIQWRQIIVSEFYGEFKLRRETFEILSGIYDIERILSRVSMRTCNPRDIAALKKSLSCIKSLAKLFTGSAPGMNISSYFSNIADFSELIGLIDRAVNDDPPVSSKDGGIIKLGFDEKLDEIIKIALGGKEWLLNLEQREQKRTGVKSLKVKYNRVFGYYIELTKANLDSIPADYIRKQTLVGAERFYTPELKEMESQILNADDNRKKMEFEIFQKILDSVMAESENIYNAAKIVATIDVLAGFAECASKYNYCRPEITVGEEIEITEGRHPVVENKMNYMGFISNDTRIGGANSHVQLITGPNMAGKSTYIRQVALIVLMAQAGSFVPARAAKIGICDRIFTRIGASDNLGAGQSTFMVEMIETANILNNATSKSLIILDEIGRGTSTYDGLAIAYAVIEYILSAAGKLAEGSRTLFATHYHELTALDKNFTKIQNLNVAISESENGIVFLHKILNGPAAKSYGIHVAKIAGLPDTVINRANDILATLEESDTQNNISKIIKSAGRRKKIIDENQLDLFEAPKPAPCPEIPEEIKQLISRLKQININEITPMGAINTLNEIIASIGDKK